MRTTERPPRQARCLALAAILAASFLAGCRSGSPTSIDVPPPSLDPASPGLVAEGVAFDREELTVPADEPFVLVFENRDSLSHNVSIYADSGHRDKRFDGEIFSGPGTRWYPVAALAPGTYVFECDLHLYMRGTLIAG